MEILSEMERKWREVLVLLMLIVPLCGWAQTVVYTSEDSLKVEQLLDEGKGMSRGGGRILHFARSFIGVPYVAATLEVGDSERLVVNLRELDCTTFVETVLALEMAAREPEAGFREFVEALRTLRYRQGVVAGYTSRLHYFTDWIDDNTTLGLVEEVTGEEWPFTAVQTLCTDFMSRHPEKYKHLQGHPERTDSIRKQENRLTGRKVRYIPKSLFKEGCDRLPVRDGDVLALTTRIRGLDVSHLGFAVWMDDGLLHLLNASSQKGRVILDERTLYQYSASLKSQTGMRVVRINP